MLRKALFDRRNNFKSRESRGLFFCPLHVMEKFSNELIASCHKLASWNVRMSNLLLVFICTIDESWHLLANNIAIHSRWLSRKNDRSCRCGLTFIIHFLQHRHIISVIYTQFVIEFVLLIKKFFMASESFLASKSWIYFPFLLL